MTLPESISPGDTGHIGDHDEIHTWLNNWTTDIIGPDGTGADIAAALGVAHARGYGTVKCEGDSYTIGGAGVALDIYLPTVNLDLGGATIFYTGSGICLRKRMDPFTIANAGYVANGTIDGSGASDGAIGIQTGAVIRAGWEGVTVQNFDGIGSVNWDQYNEAANTWMERCRFERCDSRNGTAQWQWRAHASSPSFLYNDYSDCRYDGKTGQTSIKTTAPAQLFDCDLGFRGNVIRGTTVFDLATTSILRPRMAFSVEQTDLTTTAVLFAPGSGQILYPRGSFVIVNFPDYDDAREMLDYEGRGETISLDPIIVNQIEGPLQGFGLTIGTDQLGTWTAVYDGGAGADFAVIKVPFGGTLADGRVAAQLDSVTKAEIGFRPGDFTSGGRPAATDVPRGTMIYVNDVAGGIPVWSDGTDWRDAAGTVA